MGQTRSPKDRIANHRNRFPDQLGRDPEFRVLQTVSESKANKIENLMILKYREMGQAEFNRKPYPKNKRHINLSINRALKQAVEVFVVGSTEWRNVSEFTEALWQDFLKKEGAI